MPHMKPHEPREPHVSKSGLGGRWKGRPMHPADILHELINGSGTEGCKETDANGKSRDAIKAEAAMLFAPELFVKSLDNTPRAKIIGYAHPARRGEIVCIAPQHQGMYGLHYEDVRIPDDVKGLLEQAKKRRLSDDERERIADFLKAEVEKPRDIKSVPTQWHGHLRDVEL